MTQQRLSRTERFLRLNTLHFQAWYSRVNMLTTTILERKALDFEGVYWEGLYDAGIKPLDAVAALIEELRQIELDLPATTN